MTTMLRRDPNGSTWWGNQRMIWMDGDAIHYDLIVYARARDITIEAAEKEIEEITREVLPKARIHHIID